MSKYTLEDIFCFPEYQIQQIIQNAAYNQEGFLIDRYVATVIMAKNGMMNNEDYVYASNKDFPNVYLDENLLMQNNATYFNRFSMIRSILSQESKKPLTCQDISDGFNKAYRVYGNKIINTKVETLAEKFGNEVFNIEYINKLWYEWLSKTQHPALILKLEPIIFTVAKAYDRLNGRHLNDPEWYYMKCLLKTAYQIPSLRKDLFQDFNYKNLDDVQ